MIRHVEAAGALLVVAWLTYGASTAPAVAAALAAMALTPALLVALPSLAVRTATTGHERARPAAARAGADALAPGDSPGTA